MQLVEGLEIARKIMAEPIKPTMIARDKPVIVYPNSGEQWDAHQRRWIGPSHYSTAQATGWIAAGAAVVGGCCRVRPSDIAAITDIAHTTARPG